MVNYTRQELEAFSAYWIWEDIFPDYYTTVVSKNYIDDVKVFEIHWRIIFNGVELNALTIGEKQPMQITNYENETIESLSKFEALKRFKFGGDYGRTVRFVSQRDTSLQESASSVGRGLYSQSLEDIASIPLDQRMVESDGFRAEVTARQLAIEVNEVATALVREAKFGRDDPTPAAKSMSDFVKEAAEEVKYVIADLAIWACTVILFAQAKVGKTTMVFNLIRSLVDEHPFLGTFVTSPATRNVGFINFELTENQCRDWSSRIGITNMDKVRIWNLRGLANPFRSKESMEDFALNNVLPVDIETLIIDPLSGAFIGDTNNNDEVKKFFLDLEKFKVLSGVKNLVIVVHAGNDESKPRGATTLRDHPDAIWSLSKSKSGTRHFKAEGRDVFVEEGSLIYIPATMELEFSDFNEKHISPSSLKAKILDYISQYPDAKANEIDRAIKGTKESKAEARNQLVAEGLVNVRIGVRNAKHFTAASIPAFLESSAEDGTLGVSSRSPLSIGGTTTEKEGSLDWKALMRIAN